MHLPGPLRAAIGLVASAADEARNLPDRAIELPMLAVSTALQASLRAQQRYATLTARGDRVLNRSTPTTDPPPWATFDDPVTVEELRRSALAPHGGSTGSTPGDLFGAPDPTPAATGPAPTSTSAANNPPKKSARKADAKTAAAKSNAAKKSRPKDGKTVSKPRHTAPSAFDNAAFDNAAFDNGAVDNAADD